jgi:hypothetical protein
MGAFDPPFFAIMKAKWALLSRSGRKKHHFLSLASGNFVKILSQAFRAWQFAGAELWNLPFAVP